LAARQALRGLFRPRNATRAIIITLCASLAVLFCLYLIEQNLNANFVRSYPDDAPNVFFIDLQADHVDGFSALVDTELTLFPVVRGNITAINGKPIDYEAEREREGDDNLARSFNLTYNDSLPENEVFVSGDSLFREAWEGPQVSVWDLAFQLYPFEIGDTIEFDIQGVPITAQVSSIRTRPEEQPQPAFYFILEPEVLANAPQSIFTAGRFNPADIPRLQNEVVAAYPNVTVIDVTTAIASLSSVIRRLSQVIRFFTMFSMIAGLLIIVSSIFATRFARVQEAVYFKVLGAKGRFVLRVFTLENVFLGLLSAGLALLLAQIGSWILIELVFELDYRPFLAASGLLVVMTTVLVTAVGLLASVSILRQRPIVFLREQTGEE
jgi:putative ABC transport system permease protein